MRELRNEILRLKRDYQSLRYPGDLSLDVPQAPPQPGMRLGGFLALAAAMALAATVWVFLPGQSAPPQVVVETETPSIEVAPLAHADHPPIAIEVVADRAVADRSGAPAMLIDDVADRRSPILQFRGTAEAPFVANMPAPRLGTVSVPTWGDLPVESSLSTEWIAMPQPMLTVPNVSEIDATLVSAEPAS